MGYSCEEIRIFSGVAKDIDSSSVPVDVAWTVKCGSIRSSKRES